MTRFEERILVVEDDVQIQNFISYVLKKEGFDCLVAGTAQEALSLLLTEPVEIMLLDLGLPDLDGMEVIRRVREGSEIPIVIISGREQDREKAAALDAGADDYITKPFSTTELMARVRVILRHLHAQKNPPEHTVFSAGALEIDLGKRIVRRGGVEIHVTPMEYSLLTLLFRHQGKVLTTGFIIKEIWGVGYGTDTQALRALVAGLRRKIEENHALPNYIKTEIGVGYRLMEG